VGNSHRQRSVKRRGCRRRPPPSPSPHVVMAAGRCFSRCMPAAQHESNRCYRRRYGGRKSRLRVSGRRGSAGAFSSCVTPAQPAATVAVFASSVQPQPAACLFGIPASAKRGFMRERTLLRRAARAVMMSPEAGMFVQHENLRARPCSCRREDEPDVYRRRRSCASSPRQPRRVREKACRLPAPPRASAMFAKRLSSNAARRSGSVCAQ